MAHYDFVFVGGGHNALVCAFYLARAGRKVRIFERAPVVGGAAITEEFHPGFRNSVASYSVGLLHPQVIADLDLHRHGLRIVIRPLSYFSPLDDARYLIVDKDPARTRTEVARFSARDAERLGTYHQRMDRLVETVKATAREQNLRMLGRKAEVLVEKEAKRGGELLQCRTRDFRTVLVPGDESMIGKYLTVELTGTTGSTFTGAIVRDRAALPLAV